MHYLLTLLVLMIIGGAIVGYVVWSSTAAGDGTKSDLYVSSGMSWVVNALKQRWFGDADESESFVVASTPLDKFETSNQILVDENTQTYVVQTFETVLHRPPTTEELSKYVAMGAAGKSNVQILSTIVADLSKESLERRGGANQCEVIDETGGHDDDDSESESESESEFHRPARVVAAAAVNPMAIPWANDLVFDDRGSSFGWSPWNQIQAEQQCWNNARDMNDSPSTSDDEDDEVPIPALPPKEIVVVPDIEVTIPKPNVETCMYRGIDEDDTCEWEREIVASQTKTCKDIKKKKKKCVESSESCDNKESDREMAKRLLTILDEAQRLLSKDS